MKKVLIATGAVFVAWFALDWIIHGMILSGIYEETKDLWRPMEEMSMSLSIIVGVLTSFLTCYLYNRYVDNKSLGTGIGFGLILGLIWGISMGYGTYIWSPIPYSLAMGWFLAQVFKLTVAGLLIGLIIKAEVPKAE